MKTLRDCSNIHKTSVLAFVERLRKEKDLDLEQLARRMQYSIGWPETTRAYVLYHLQNKPTQQT